MMLGRPSFLLQQLKNIVNHTTDLPARVHSLRGHLAVLLMLEVLRHLLRGVRAGLELIPIVALERE